MSKLKKLFFAFLLAVMTVTFIGCNETETTTENAQSDTDMTILKFAHLDGHGTELMKDMPILFEYEMRDYVKYQIAFVSCTCRAPKDNFWSVAYVDIDKATGELLYMSFRQDSSEHYQAAVWGDSSPIPDTGVTLEDFEETFIPHLIGMTPADLEGVNIIFDTAPGVYADYANTKDFGNQTVMDTYAGSSVSANSLLRVTKAILNYHTDKYVE